MIVLDTNVVFEAMKAQPTPAVRAWLDAQVAETLYQLATSAANAIAGIAVDITSAGVGRHIRSILTGLVGWRILIVINC